jgi:hypothetical protein
MAADNDLDPDLTFLAGALKGADRLLFLMGILSFLAAPMCGLIATGAASPILVVAWLAGAVLSGVVGSVLVRAGRRKGPHPVLDALMTDPKAITEVQFQSAGRGAIGALTPSGHLHIALGPKKYVIYCDGSDKRDRLLSILRDRTPHLA